MGPRDDGYEVGRKMSAHEAGEYHSLQIQVFKDEGVDFLTAYTLNYSDEALGVVQKCKDIGLPCVISFTTGTDGNIPSGEKLEDCIRKIDKETGNYPIHYQINCAHPSHFYDALSEMDKEIALRLKAILANASKKSHSELDNCTELDKGDKQELAEWYLKLKKVLPNLCIIGGCCGTDWTHLDEIVGTWKKNCN
mmetsp:Transcript_45354/g.38203  ORF Transcript_45354/g.38203 Transcript_45354/m.38203 type:complete len:194 (+) Transcript_45354:349-930(+)